ncbi:BolA family protein [Luteimonas vadosa]|uniref:BolA family transcriptional regulator n=1 Tax=Luteimonas vadosa TaxID=1165507 RepID=A0ABP9E1R0_9GAMM
MTAARGPLPRERRVEAIRAALETAFRPEALEIRDDSHRHAGHVGAQDGRGHFHVTIRSACFAGLAPLQRHRAIYGALGPLMDTDIHALSIQASAPEGAA